VHHARGPSQTRFRYFIFKRDHIIRARRNKKVGYGRARGEPAQREKDQWHTVQFEELLGRFRPHAGAESSGGNDGSNAAHRSETVYRTPMPIGEPQVARHDAVPGKINPAALKIVEEDSFSLATTAQAPGNKAAVDARRPRFPQLAGQPPLLRRAWALLHFVPLDRPDRRIARRSSFPRWFGELK
jgi:hypothetical protein